jgi:HAMP domain-containing protein
MKIRTKLVGGFLLVALLVPVLGGIAVRQVTSINDDVQTLSQGAIPTLLAVHELERLQEDQQVAALTYFASGREPDRLRYAELAQEFDRRLAALTEQGGRAGRSRAIGDLAAQLVDEHARFTAAAEQILDSRGTVDGGLVELRRWSDTISVELSYIFQRFAAANRRPSDAVAVPEAARRENSELIAGAEGMLRVIGLAYAQAAAYAIGQTPSLKVQFEEDIGSFNEWLAVARNAGNTNDRAILARVETEFQQFEAAARAMLRAADFAAQSRGVFAEASGSIIGLLDQMAAQASANTDAARTSAESTSANAARLMGLLTLIAFGLAGALGVWLSGTLTRPITHLRDVAERVSQGDFEDVEISVETQDEVGDLARAFRRMVASLRILMPQGSDEGELGIGRL